jgi:hypothetical protein
VPKSALSQNLRGSRWLLYLATGRCCCRHFLEPTTSSPSLFLSLRIFFYFFNLPQTHTHTHLPNHLLPDGGRLLIGTARLVKEEKGKKETCWPLRTRTNSTSQKCKCRNGRNVLAAVSCGTDHIGNALVLASVNSGRAVAAELKGSAAGKEAADVTGRQVCAVGPQNNLFAQLSSLGWNGSNSRWTRDSDYAN